MHSELRRSQEQRKGFHESSFTSFGATVAMAEINSVQEKLQQVTDLLGSESKEAAGSIAGAGSDSEEAGKARNILLDICADWIFPAALRTVVELDVAHILASHATKYDKAGLTAEELVQYMPDATCPSPLILERLLRMLVTKGIFAEHVVLNDVAHGDHTITRVVRRFSLNSSSRYLVPGTPDTLRYWTLLTTLSPEFAAALEFLG